MKYISLIASLVGFAAAESPNLFSQQFPNLRTAAQNTSFFIVPVPKDIVKPLVSPYKLLPVPEDAELFPQGWDNSKHPVIVYTSLQNEIKIEAAGVPLAIDQLLGSSLYVPYTDVLKDGKSAFQHPVRNYIGGTEENDLMSIVPALVGSLAGTVIVPASFDPANQVYTTSPGGTESSEINQIYVPNIISGPGVEGVAYSLTSTPGANPMYTTQTYVALNNQPILLEGLTSVGDLLGLPFCQRNSMVFFYEGYEGYQIPEERTGKVQFGTPLVAPSGLARKMYENTGCLTATVQIVGNNPQLCRDAINEVYPLPTLD